VMAISFDAVSSETTVGTIGVGQGYRSAMMGVMFCNTLEIILTNPNCPQCYGTQHNDFDS